MIKKEITAIAAAVVILAALMGACGSEPAPAQASATPTAADVSVVPVSPSPSVTAAAVTLKDGTYQYTGRKDNEVYYVEGTMVVSGGVIQSMEWWIIDAQKNRVFDGTYEEVFTGNDLYIQQSRDNWSGMQTYVPALLDTQDPDKVDAVSGATWAYKKFEEAAKALIEQASE